VTSTKSGAAELVVQNDAGSVCDARDAAALGGHMRALCDPALRSRQGGNARRAVEPLSAEAMTLARNLVTSEQYLLAIPVLDRALKASPANADAKSLLAKSYRELGCPRLAK